MTQMTNTGLPTGAAALPAPSDSRAIGLRALEELGHADPATRAEALAAQQAVLDAGGTREQGSMAFLRVALAARGAMPAAVALYTEEAIQMLDVSPESFVALLRAQVDREDEKILEARNAIERALAGSREASARMEILQEIHQLVSQQDDQDRDMNRGELTIDGQAMTIGDAVMRYDLVDELNLSDAYDPNDPMWFRGHNLKAEAVQSAIDVIRQEQQQITSANELNMIAMQQAMQQRGQHIQLVSKVLAMMADTERAIVGNMR